MLAAVLAFAVSYGLGSAFVTFFESLNNPAPPLFALVVALGASAAAFSGAGRFYDWWLERWMKKQGDKYGLPPAYSFLRMKVMWYPTFEMTRSMPHLMLLLADLASKLDGLPKNVSIPGLFERKAQALLESGVWLKVADDERCYEAVEAVVAYPLEDKPEDLRELFDMAGTSQAIAYLRITRDSRAALDAVRSGIPVEYLSATQ